MKVEGPNLKPMSEIIIEKELKGTPLEGQAKNFIDAGVLYNIDPLFLVAIGYHESKYASAYPSEVNEVRHNYAGVMTYDQNTGKRRLKNYSSWEEAIYDHARILREIYLNKNKDTVRKIWMTYAPLGELTNDSWGNVVGSKYVQLKRLAS